jgi:hypothetical protein
MLLPLIENVLDKFSVLSQGVSTSIGNGKNVTYFSKRRLRLSFSFLFLSFLLPFFFFSFSSSSSCSLPPSVLFFLPLPLPPLLSYFGDLMNYLPKLASNHDPPDLSLSSS